MSAPDISETSPDDDPAGADGNDSTAMNRGFWGLIDQALSSLTNMGLGFAVARLVTQSDFGAFGALLAAYLMMLAVKNALVTQPLLLRFSATSGRSLDRDAARGAVSGSAALGMAAAVVLLGVAVVLDGQLQLTAILVGLGMPGLLVHDTVRHVFIGAGDPRQATMADFTWAVLQFPAIAIYAVVGDPTVAGLSAIWVVSGGLAGLIFAYRLGIAIRPRAGIGWMRSQQDLGASILAEQVLITGSETIGIWLIAVIGGLSAAGAINGGLQLNGPARVAGLAVLPFVVPELRRRAAQTPERLLQTVVWVAFGLGVVLVAISSTTLLLPDRLGVELLGDSWADARGVVFPLAVMIGAKAATNVISTGLRLHGRQPLSLRIRLLTSPIAVAATAIGAAISGALGGALGLLIAAVLGTALGIGVLRWVSVRRDPSVPLGIDGS